MGKCLVWMSVVLPPALALLLSRDLVSQLKPLKNTGMTDASLFHLNRLLGGKRTGGKEVLNKG